jgi:hypothetical protein
MTALQVTGPPGEKEAPARERQGQLRKLLRDETVPQTDPPDKISRIDPLAWAFWPRLAPDAKARARMVRLRRDDPIGTLVAVRHSVCIVDIIALDDGMRQRQRGARR